MLRNPYRGELLDLPDLGASDPDTTLYIAWVQCAGCLDAFEVEVRERRDGRDGPLRSLRAYHSRVEAERRGAEWLLRHQGCGGVLRLIEVTPLPGRSLRWWRAPAEADGTHGVAGCRTDY